MSDKKACGIQNTLRSDKTILCSLFGRILSYSVTNIYGDMFAEMQSYMMNVYVHKKN